VKLERLYATGKHLVYTSATDVYVLTGQPVVAIQKDQDGSCKQTEGTTLTYERTNENMRMEGPGGVPVKSKPLDACPAELRR
jgi:lipopolysaccharide export system protein LptA